MYKDYYSFVSDLIFKDVLICGSLDSTLFRALCSFEFYIQGVQKTIVNYFHEHQNDFVKEIEEKYDGNIER